MVKVEHLTGIFQADEDIKLQSYTWKPANKKIKAICLAIHGGLTYSEDWAILSPAFAQKHIALMSIDLRYHGRYAQHNPGQKVYFHIESYEQYIEDIHHYYLHIKKQYPDTPIFILGHSNGGLISLYYGLTRAPQEIKGFLISSPWLKNKVLVPPLLLKLLKIIAFVHPKFEVTPADISEHLTHDRKIMEHHVEASAKGLRGKTATAKLGLESMKTQQYVIEHIKEWKKFPLWAVIAGDDYLADAETSLKALSQVPKNLITTEFYENNYHENFNELNREEIFEKMLNWIEQRLKNK